MNPIYQKIPGKLVVVGKQPDGDSVRFIPDEPQLLEKLRFASRVKKSTDGSVQLRFDGIDAPEVHYQGQAQPVGGEARQALLRHIGFKATFDGNTITDATPKEQQATIWSQMVEVHGRPVAFVVLGSPTALGVEQAIGSSLNAWLLRTGWAYPTLYTSTPPTLRTKCISLARVAKQQKLGVWRGDRSAAFRLRSQADIGPDGQLILPKLFRRATDFLRDTTSGTFPGTLADWLKTKKEDDALWLDGKQRHLHEIFTLHNGKASFAADPLDIVFVER